METERAIAIINLCVKLLRVADDLGPAVAPILSWLAEEMEVGEAPS